MAPSPIDLLLKPVRTWTQKEYTGGIILFISVLVALLWANSPWAASYHSLWETRFSVGFAGHRLEEPLHVWINDGLMAVFFFVIGLELKREFMAGELSSAKKATLPMVAALGGMLVPALIYLAFNAGKATEAGWGIPMATDIAFALGILSLAGKHVPVSVKVFLSALAVADDLGAILVIAFFYSTHIAVTPLITAFALLILLGAANAAGTRNPLVYLLTGITIWLCFLASGVHATIAGVLVAFTIPARTKINELEFASCLKTYTAQFEHAMPQQGTLTTAEQHDTIQQIKKLALAAETPLQKIEHNLKGLVTFGIMPLFALANAGIVLDGNIFTALANPVSKGVLFGLFAGKPCGILLFTWIMIRFRLSSLPRGASWKHITGVSLLAGVGFTMSLFVTDLAFDHEVMTGQAKTAILIASMLAGVSGAFFLRKQSR